MNGVGRKIRLVPKYNHDQVIDGFDKEMCYICEGNFQNDELNGFGRKLFNAGYSFIGWVSDAKLHGYG